MNRRSFLSTIILCISAIVSGGTLLANDQIVLATPEIAVESPLINQYAQASKEKAEQLPQLMAAILDIRATESMQLMSLFNPILSICMTIASDAQSPSLLHVYSAIRELHYSVSYIDRLLDQGIAEAGEFLPEPLTQEITDPTILEQEWNLFATAFNKLINKINEAGQDLWGTALMHLKSQMNQLDKILGDINMNVTHSAIVNKADVKQEIMDMRNMLRFLQKDLATKGINPIVIMHVHAINKAFIQHIRECQEHKFRKWVNFDPLAESKRFQEDLPQTSQEALIRIMMTNDELNQLEKDAEALDLTFVNKTARFLDTYVITPVERYDLDFYIPAALCTIVGSAYYFPDYFFDNKNSLFRRVLGFPDQSGFVTVPKEEQRQSVEFAEQPDKRPVKAFGKIEKKFRSFFISSEYPIGQFLATFFAKGAYDKWKMIRPEMYKKIRAWFTRLKGGSFIKLAEKYDRIISSSVTFENVIGHEYEKSLIYPFIKYIKDPERWDARELTPPTGILLTGPTRSGKTFFAKAICGELSKQMANDQLRFVSLDAHDIKANGIQMLMTLAKAIAPCVIFIDEIDLLGLQRNQDRTMLSDFLQALSGIADNDPKKKVIVIGTTNKPENIDHALIQSGRLALEIRFKYPNLSERIEYIKNQLNKFAIDPEMFDIDVNQLARETEGRSFEDIKLVIDSAFIHVGIKGDILSQDILEWALDTQLRKIIDIDTKDISDQERRSLAAHFAGQALTQILLGMDERIAKVTINQVVVKVKEESVYDQYYQQTKQTGLEQGALFTYLPHDTLDIKNQDEILKKAKTFLGARVAERIVTRTCSTAYGWKKTSAFNMIKTIIADGLDLKSLSKKEQNDMSDRALEKLKECEAELEQLLREHHEALIALTDALQSKKTLTYAQIIKIMDQVEGRSQKATESIKQLDSLVPATS